MAGEWASDASSDSSNTFWDLATCAVAVAAYAAENPNGTAMSHGQPNGSDARAIRSARGYWATMGGS